MDATCVSNVLIHLAISRKNDRARTACFIFTSSSEGDEAAKKMDRCEPWFAEGRGLRGVEAKTANIGTTIRRNYVSFET